MSSDSSVRQTTVPKAGERPAGSWRDNELARLRLHIRTLVGDLMRDVLDAVAKASTAEIGELIGLDRGRRRNGAKIRFDQPARDGTVLRSFVEPPSLDKSEERVAAAETNGASATHSAGRSRYPRAAPSESTARGRLLGAPLRTTPTRQSGAGSMNGRHSRQRREESERPSRAPLPHSPFDITSPGELLASTSALSSLQAKTADMPKAEASQAAVHVRPLVASIDSGADTNSRTGPMPASAPTTENVVALSATDSEAASERRPRVVLREGERLLSATGSGVVIRRERRR
jgi:hypothetical protein